MSRKPSKPETRIEDYLDVMTGGNAALPQPILRIEFYYAFLAGMTVELPQPILDDEKLLAKICGMEVEAPTYIPGISPRLYAYMAKKGGQDVQIPDPILRLERYWYDYSAGSPPSVQEYTGAVPVTFIADGTPLLDFLISGNMEQSGTPTPDNPITPQGTGERTGNLINIYANNTSNGYVNNALLRSDGSTYSPSSAYISEYLPIEDNKTYTYYTGGRTGVAQAVCFYNAAKEYISGISYDNQTAITFTTPQGTKYYRCTVMRTASDTESYKKTMLNLGSTALPYEPYGQYKIPISMGGTTTPVYLGEVQTTRQIKKIVFVGSEDENWSAQSAGGGAMRFRYAISNSVQADTAHPTSICTHLPLGAEGGTWNTDDIYTISSNYLWVRLDSSFTTVALLKSWLAQQYAAGTPVTVWYVLANPETAVVNEPLMRIGDYADTLSMEQAGAQIPTANGSTTLDVETTVPPSEIYIKYRGEAVATLSSLPAEVSSPEATTEEANPEENKEE